MARKIEVFGLEELDVAYGIGVQQQRTEHGTLGFEILRNSTPLQRRIDVNHGPNRWLA